MRSHLLGDEAEVPPPRPSSALEDWLEDAVVAGRVGAVDALAVQAADARAEAHADHDERGDCASRSPAAASKARRRRYSPMRFGVSSPTAGR